MNRADSSPARLPFPSRTHRSGWRRLAAALTLGLSAAAGLAGAPAQKPRAASQPTKPVAAKAVTTTPASTAMAAPSADTFCTAIVKRVPSLSAAQCTAAGLRDTNARSVRGAPIMVREVPASTDVTPSAMLGVVATTASAASLSLGTLEATARSTVDTDEGPTTGQAAEPAHSGPRRILVLGAIHGDELTATTLAMNWLAAADKAAPQAYSRRIDWRFVPVLNPDGLLGLKPSRTNARGVDLNRNFPTLDWSVLAPKWWQESTRRDPRRFPGPQALSEPESRWVHDEMAAWQPDLIVSIHAPFGVLDFDGPVDPPKRIGRLWLDPVGVYPGSLGNYGGLSKGVPVLTIELAHALKPPSEAEMQGMWQDMLTWIERRWNPRPTAASAVSATPAH